jgi:lipopolysaccharide transport system ATP-binding protein
MGDVAIRVQGLGKQYRIGGPQAPYQTFREAIVRGASAPFRRLRGERPQESTIWALDEVSFEVKHGEAVGIIGRNGAGKSTLLKVLSRITKPTRGRVDLYGRVGSLLEVGTGFHPELTGRENIYLNGAILGMTRREIRRKFDEIVDFAEIEKFLDTPVKHYSSGMYVRLAFAVAAHLESEILLVDEVLAVGDAQFQKKSLAKMGEVAKRGITVLFVSHNMATVENLCQVGVLLDHGSLRHTGRMIDVIDAYMSASATAAGGGTPGEFVFADRINTYAGNRRIIQKVTLLDADNVPRDGFQMGRELNIRVDLDGLSDCPNSAIGIIFKNHAGQTIAGINTSMSCAYLEETRSRFEYGLLRIPRLHFVPGNYSIAVSITSDEARVDYIDHAASFSVEASDVYGTGFRVGSEYGLLYIEGAWEIRAPKTADRQRNGSSPLQSH